MNIRGYDVGVQKLSRELGGGFIAFVPALKGCLADGETQVQALSEVEAAIDCWLEVARKKGQFVPQASVVSDG